MSAPTAAYVAGLEAALRQCRPRIADMARSWEAEAQLIVRIDAALSAHPDAPDVRMVTVAQLERWYGKMGN